MRRWLWFIPLNLILILLYCTKKEIDRKNYTLRHSWLRYTQLLTFVHSVYEICPPLWLAMGIEAITEVIYLSSSFWLYSIIQKITFEILLFLSLHKKLRDKTSYFTTGHLSLLSEPITFPNSNGALQVLVMSEPPTGLEIYIGTGGFSVFIREWCSRLGG